MIRFAPKPVPAPRPPSCSRSVADQIADVLRELGGAGEPVTIEALSQRGFPEAVVRRHADFARGIARRQFVRRIEA